MQRPGSTNPKPRRGAVCLASTVEGDALPGFVERVRLAKSARLRVVVSYAASRHAPGWGIRPFVQRAFERDRVDILRLPGEAKTTSGIGRAEARALLMKADLIVLGPGDPVLAAERLARSGADRWIGEAVAAGTSVVGVSAGAIVLGEWWATWPDQAAHGHRPFCGGRLVRCLGLVPGLVVDCHDEADAWEELALMHDLIDDAGIEGLRLGGLPRGAGLLLTPDGAREEVGRIHRVTRSERRVA